MTGWCEAVRLLHCTNIEDVIGHSDRVLAIGWRDGEKLASRSATETKDALSVRNV